MRKPKNTDDMNIDIYFEQFSHPKDPPTVTVNNANDCYEFHHAANNSDLRQELKRMRKDAQWLLKAADYLEKTLVK